MTQDAYPVNVVRHRTSVARRLAAGECGGWYGDAVLIISSAISAIAADLYRGERIDRRRFVETWVRYSDQTLQATRISIPLLGQQLFESGDEVNLGGLRQLREQVFWLFPEQPDTLVLHGDADASEREVQSACPNLPKNVIRQFSYPNVFYSEIRSGFVHEGDTTELGSTHPGGSRPADISYANVIQKPFRRIYFSVEWLSRVAESIAVNSQPEIYKLRQPLPSVWWLDER